VFPGERCTRAGNASGAVTDLRRLCVRILKIAENLWQRGVTAIFQLRHMHVTDSEQAPAPGMDIDAWTADGVDHLRRRRLVFGGALGATVMAGVVAISLTVKPVVAEPADDKIIEVKLAETLPEPEPEPEPEPPPPPEPVAQQAPPPANRAALPSLTPPTEVSDAALTEAEPTNSNGAEGDPYAKGVVSSGARPAPAPIVVQKPAPPAPPKRSGPMRVTENVTPPKSLSQASPTYPAEAKQAGIEGVVLIKYVVTEAGTVTNITVLRGPAELRQVCIEALSKWTFQPAIFEGRPVAVFRIARFPFRITT